MQKERKPLVEVMGKTLNQVLSFSQNYVLCRQSGGVVQSPYSTKARIMKTSQKDCYIAKKTL